MIFENIMIMVPVSFAQKIISKINSYITVTLDDIVIDITLHRYVSKMCTDFKGTFGFARRRWFTCDAQGYGDGIKVTLNTPGILSICEIQAETGLLGRSACFIP